MAEPVNATRLHKKLHEISPPPPTLALGYKSRGSTNTRSKRVVKFLVARYG